MKALLSFLARPVKDVQREYARLGEKRAKAILRYSLLGAFVVGMAAHAFAYFNFVPIHDAVNYIGHLAGGWEISLGRFFQVVYGRIRGEYAMPWLSGMLSMLYIGLASFLINELLGIDEPWCAFLTAGLLMANATMTNLILVFTYVTDVLALALLIACIGAYAVIRLSGWLGVMAGSVCFAASMGLYQSYALFGGMVLVSYVMLQAADDREMFRHQYLNWIRYALAVVGAACVYIALYAYFMWSYGVGMASASSYNSPAKVASLDVKTLIPLFRQAYTDFAKYFWGMGSGELNQIQAGTVALCLLTGCLFVLHAIRKKLPLANVLLIGLGVALFPGLAQVFGVLAGRGGAYALTAHALYLLYPFMLALIQRVRTAAGKAGARVVNHAAFKAAVVLLCSIVLFGNIRHSNEMYTFGSIQYDKTISYVTRLIERIHNVPGYVHKNTEVVFTGYMSANLINVEEPDGFALADGMNQSAITYLQVLKSFVHMMGDDMNIPLDYSDMPDYGAMEEVRAMPAFPDPGCIRMMDGRVLVKLSDY